MEEMISLEVPRHFNDMRADSALTGLVREKLPEKPVLSRSFLAQAIKDGKVLCNGTKILPRSLVATHDVFSISPLVFAETAVLRPASDSKGIAKVFENERLIILEKSAGIQMHAGGSYDGTTVAGWVAAQHPELADIGEDTLRPGIVHRLDRDTSGLLIIAKDNLAFKELKKAFQNRKVEKTYYTLVYGHLRDLQGEVKASLMRKPGELKRRAIDPETYEGTLPGNTRTALTGYRVIARYEDYDLVELQPKTGRTHQIRVHMSFLGHPVVGDTLYAWKDAKRKKLLIPSRHLLHAAQLSFRLFGEKYRFQSPLPPDFRAVLDSIDETLISSYDDEALKSLF